MGSEIKIIELKPFRVSGHVDFGTGTITVSEIVFGQMITKKEDEGARYEKKIRSVFLHQCSYTFHDCIDM